MRTSRSRSFSAIFCLGIALHALSNGTAASNAADGKGPSEHTFTAEHHYLLLPVKNGAPRKLMTFLVQGRLERQFEIELAEGQPDWWAFLDLAPFKGRQSKVTVDGLPADSMALAAMHQSDRLEGAEPLYAERLRPQFHFTSRRGWNNDPNGLVFYRGEYHLFYQHNPFGWAWGNMHWGHAVSRDLVHWRELDDALVPDATGTMFSGSAVVDWSNTAGFQQRRERPLVCCYTAAGGTSPMSKGQPFTQGLAYSLDRGRTWTKYAHNPVLPHIVGENRDPKVFWYTPRKKWIMALYLEGNHYGLFSSPDLKQWEKLSTVTIPGTSECPEFFPIPVEGKPGESRWVFYGGNGRYLVGRFDGETFTAESGPHPLNFGNCFYASQTFNDLPAQDGRRILVPWGQVATPGMPFNQMIGLPVELTLRLNPEGPRLYANPVRELKKLRTRSWRIHPQPIGASDNPLKEVHGELLDLELETAVGGASAIELDLRGIPLTYDAGRAELKCLDKVASLKPENGTLQLHVLVDRTSLDIFANHGQLYMPMGVIMPAENKTVAIRARGDGATLIAAEAHLLKSIWR